MLSWCSKSEKALRNLGKQTQTWKPSRHGHHNKCSATRERNVMKEIRKPIPWATTGEQLLSHICRNEEKMVGVSFNEVWSEATKYIASTSKTMHDDELIMMYLKLLENMRASIINEFTYSLLRKYPIQSRKQEFITQTFTVIVRLYGNRNTKTVRMKN